MKLHNLKPAEGAVKNKGKRLGRGIGCGKGSTSARGHNGAKSRSGYAKKTGLEGGQLPLQRRVPKFGFHNISTKEYRIINLDRRQELVDEGRIKDEVGPEQFADLRVAKKTEMVKVLGRGELKAKLTISAHKFTASAKAAIEKAGGEAKTL